MEQHESSNRTIWPDTRWIQASGKQGDKFHPAAPKLLYLLTVESQRLGGEVLDHFWKQLRATQGL